MRRILKNLYIFACANLGVFAQGQPTNLLTPALINQFAEEARTNHSALWASRARINAATQNVRSIPLWRDPEVMLGGMAADRMMREEDGDIMYGVEQMLPVFGKEKAARAAARKEVEVEESELDYRFQAIRRALSEALFKAALADQVLAISQEDLEWLEASARAVELRYQAGSASQVDALRIQNERSKRAQQARNEANNREDAYTTVNRLLNRNIISAWARLDLPPIAAALSFSDRLTELALEHEPRLQKMRKELEYVQATVQMSRTGQRPDLTAAVAARQYSGTGEGRSATFLLKMSLPWLNRDKYRAAIHRDEAKVQEMESAIEDQSYEVSAGIHHLIARIDNARREALLYETEIIPRTTLALASAEAAWQFGDDVFRDVIEARRMLVEARLMRSRAIAEQHVSIYELLVLCGVSDLDSLAKVTLNREANQ